MNNFEIFWLNNPQNSYTNVWKKIKGRKKKKTNKNKWKGVEFAT
jgi:hypothetical protein